MSADYSEFLAGKLALTVPSGFEPARMPGTLFDFQMDLVAWALRCGKSAIFASTGLGKTRMQLEWSRQVVRHTHGRVLILAPLAVAAQTVAEGALLGLDVALCRSGADVRPGISVANYERLHLFDASAFAGVVLDESSCIKHHNSKTLAQLIASFERTPYRLCATATPAPNDWTELGTHAEFLGICYREEMLAEFFCHDGGETSVWRLKGHARQHFWRWVASWGAMVRTPDDIGRDGAAYKLPPLNVHHHIHKVTSESIYGMGELFPRDSMSLSERRDAKKSSISERVQGLAALVNDSAEPWVVWCDLNAEADALAESIPDAVEVRGSDTIDEKEERLVGFAEGRHRVLISKQSICGWGLNWQHCARMAFVGMNDSFEGYFQAVRRCWRFGQRRAVEVHVFGSELDAPVLKNLDRKAADAERMGEELSRETSESVKSAVRGQRRLQSNQDHKQELLAPEWLHTRGA